MKWLLVVALASCGQRPEPAATEALGSLDAWGPPDPAAWQGAHTLRVGTRVLAIDIRGDGAKSFDGETEEPLGFTIVTPCAVHLTVSSNGALEGYTRPYVIDRGGVVIGEGGAGKRRGLSAIACRGERTFILDRGACRVWDATGQATTASCAWSKTADGRDQLVADGAPWIAEGDVLMDEAFRASRSRHHASFEAAKHALP